MVFTQQILWCTSKTWIENHFSFDFKLTLRMHLNVLILCVNMYLDPPIVLTNLVQSLITQVLLGSIDRSNLNHTLLKDT